MGEPPSPGFSASARRHVNAFAVPGVVSITRGRVAHLNREDELAAVLSHEVAHITALHGTLADRDRERMARRGGGLSTGIDLGDVARGRRQLKLLANSRERELAADRLALRYLRRAEYRPEAMSSVITLLARLDTRSDRVPAWSRTHPAPQARARVLDSLLDSGGSPLLFVPHRRRGAVGVLEIAQGRDGVITLIALGPKSLWPRHEVEVVTTLNSQRLLTEEDRVALGPTRIALVEASEGQALRTIASDPPRAADAPAPQSCRRR